MGEEARRSRRSLEEASRKSFDWLEAQVRTPLHGTFNKSFTVLLCE